MEQRAVVIGWPAALALLATTTLTATAETIKARISDEVWERQWRLNQKRDIHARLVKP